MIEKTLSIVLTGKTDSDIAEALRDALKKINKGLSWGESDNWTGQYKFLVESKILCMKEGEITAAAKFIATQFIEEHKRAGTDLGLPEARLRLMAVEEMEMDMADIDAGYIHGDMASLIQLMIDQLDGNEHDGHIILVDRMNEFFAGDDMSLIAVPETSPAMS